MKQIRKREEQDVYTGWRKVMAYYTKAGRAKAVKQRTHRRDRRVEAINEIKDQLSD